MINILGRLERDVLPWIGRRTIREIEAPELLSLLRRIEERGAVETAHRTLQNCGQILRYAIATGRSQRDFTPDLRGALAQAVETDLPAIIDPKTIGALLRAIDGYTGSFVTRCALQLAPLYLFALASYGPRNGLNSILSRPGGISLSRK